MQAAQRDPSPTQPLPSPLGLNNLYLHYFSNGTSKGAEAQGSMVNATIVFGYVLMWCGGSGWSSGGRATKCKSLCAYCLFITLFFSLGWLYVDEGDGRASLIHFFNTTENWVAKVLIRSVGR